MQRPGLLLLAVATAVEAELGHHQRAIVGQVLQPREIALELLAALEVDVEGEEVEARQPQVLGRGEVDVGDQRAGVLLPGGAAQAREKALDPRAPLPAHDRRRDLVSDRVAEHGRVTRARPDRRAYRLLDPVGGARVEKRDVLLPGDPDHDQQAMLLREVEQPRLRRRVHPHSVDAGARHLGEVRGGGLSIESAVRVRAERPVRDALDDQLLLAEIERLATNHRPRLRDRRIAVAGGWGVWERCRSHHAARRRDRVNAGECLSAASEGTRRAPRLARRSCRSSRARAPTPGPRSEIRHPASSERPLSCLLCPVFGVKNAVGAPRLVGPRALRQRRERVSERIVAVRSRFSGPAGPATTAAPPRRARVQRAGGPTWTFEPPVQLPCRPAVKRFGVVRPNSSGSSFNSASLDQRRPRRCPGALFGRRAAPARPRVISFFFAFFAPLLALFAFVL